MTTVTQFLSQPWWRLIAFCCLPLILFPLVSYLVVAPFGSQLFLWFSLFLSLPVIAGLFGLLSAPVLFCIRRLRPLAIRALMASLVLMVAIFLGLRLGHHVRMAAFHALSERSAPLVKAIHTFAATHGQPPTDLSKLVPEFLPAIPTTGMAAYPHYDYHVGEKADKINGNPWFLVVFTPSGGINFDQFMYLPLQNYPEHEYREGLQRIADWAYVHE